MKDLLKDIRKAIEDRGDWEKKQEIAYRMRYEGVKRAKKPYPNAPDTHYPLIDTMIEKLKPSYLDVIYGKELLAAFTCKKPQSDELTHAAEKLLDYELKQKTNFERCFHAAIDRMLNYGNGPVKTYWNADKKEICFSPIRPIYIITPPWSTVDIQASDWVVHVLRLSEAQYRRNSRYEQNDNLIKNIKGRGDETYQSQQDDISVREGITCGATDDEIVLWEIYNRDGDSWKVKTISPLIEEPVRDDFGLPYKHKQIPICDLFYELSDTARTSPRGIAEILKEDELELCKLRNHKLQFLDFHGQPTFTNSGGISNITNFKNYPGAVYPQGVEPNIPTSAPVDYSQEMQMQRALAEDRVSVPDLSNGQHLVGDRGSGSKVTATQINALVGQSSGGNDMRSRVFRLQLALIYQQAWSLLVQYKGNDSVTLSDLTEVPAESIHDEYEIKPSGSADAYSKEQRMARKLALFQQLRGDPLIEPIELDKMLLEEENPELVKRLIKDPTVTPASQLQSDLQWVEAMQQKGIPIQPEVAQLLLQHGQAYATQIQESGDQQGMALLQQVGPAFQLLQQIASGAPTQGQEQAPQGPAQAPQAPPASPMAPAGLPPQGMAQQAAPPMMGPQGETQIPLTLSVPAQPPAPAPVVNVPAPIVRVAPPVVNVTPPAVHVQPPMVHVAAPVVNVAAPSGDIEIAEIKRDKDGHIKSAKIKRK